MDQTKEKWDEAFEHLIFSDDYIFKLVMERVELFKAVLALILPQVDVERMVSLETEKPMTLGYFLHGVRFDILAKGLKKLIDMEIQVLDTGELPERALYYLASLIVCSLKKGQTYNLLGESYVVFFCRFDPFGKGLPVYNFSMRCDKKPRLQLTQNARIIFFNAAAWLKCKNKALRALLRYIMTGEATSDLTHRIDAAVSEIKHDSKTKGGWSMLYETIVAEHDRGYARGKKDGIPIGYNKGISVGEKRGISIGSHEARVATARRALERGFAPDVVAELTGLPLNEVMRLV